MVNLLWFHVAGLFAFSLLQGFPRLALGAGRRAGRRRRDRRALRRRPQAASAIVATGLLTASALLVHTSGGYIEAHFHFFVMIAVLRSTRTGCRSCSRRPTSSCITASMGALAPPASTTTPTPPHTRGSGRRSTARSSPPRARPSVTPGGSTRTCARPGGGARPRARRGALPLPSTTRRSAWRCPRLEGSLHAGQPRALPSRATREESWTA